MKFLNHTLPALPDNLALDESLLLAAEDGGPEALRVWEWPRPAIVLGASCQLALEIEEIACRQDDVPIARRGSGGGTVLLGPGCLLFSLVLSFERHSALGELHPSYRFILDKNAAALRDVAPGIVQAGISDLAIAGRKVSGSAQQRKRTHLLHHGTFLHAFDLNLIPRYLKSPPRQPEYRQNRDHLDFVMNLSATAAELIECLRGAWSADEEMRDLPLDQVRKLVVEKYGNDEWIRRR